MPRFVEGIYFFPDDRGRAIPSDESVSYVTLEVSPDAKRGIASSLRVAKGKPGTAAIKELGDNVFDWAVDTPDQTTKLHIILPSFNPQDASHDTLKVEGLWEKGMNLSGLQKMVTIGKPIEAAAIETEAEVAEDVSVVGLFGFGFKTAAIGAGNDVRVLAHARGEENQYEFNEPGYGDFRVPYSGVRPIKKTVAEDRECGKVSVAVSRLRLKKDEWPTREELADALAERYRPRLATEEVPFALQINHPVAPRDMIDKAGNFVKLPDRVIVTIAGGKKKLRRVLPLDYQLDPPDGEKLQAARTSEGEVVPFWIAEKGRDAKDTDPGLRYYLSGIMVYKGGLAGHETGDPRLSRVIGGVHADHVRDFGTEVLAISKSAGEVNRDAPAWRRMEAAVHDAIAPLIEQIKSRPSETVGSSRNLDIVLQNARKFADMAIAETLASGVLTQPMVAKATGEDIGQRLAKRGTGKTEGQTSEHLGIMGKRWEEQTGRTFPSVGSSPKIPRRRKGLVQEGRFVPFEAGDPRASTVAVEAGRKIIYVNERHPEVAHQLARMNSDPKAAEVNLGWLVATELVNHAVAELGLTDLQQVAAEIAKSRFAVGKLIREDPVVQMVENRPAPEARTKKKK